MKRKDNKDIRKPTNNDERMERKASHACWWKIVQIQSLDLEKHLTCCIRTCLNAINERWLTNLNIVASDRDWVDGVFMSLEEFYPDGAPKSYEEYCDA